MARDPEDDPTLTRREAIALGAAAAAAPLLGLPGCPASGDDDDSVAPDDDDAVSDDDDAAPVEFVSEPMRVLPEWDGGPLEFGWVEVPMVLPTVQGGDEHQRYTVRVRGYNGDIVGPTLRLSAGDPFRLTLRNTLDAPWEPPSPGPVPRDCDHQNVCVDGSGAALADLDRGHNFPHALNTTNLHTHGMQVSPEGAGDNVFTRVGPGESHDYDFGVLPDGSDPAHPHEHTAGTHWYHPHKHGAVTAAMWAGACGAIVVEGALDDYLHNVLGMDPANERVLVFTNLLLPRVLPPGGGVVGLPEFNPNAYDHRDIWTYPVGDDGAFDPRGARPEPYVLLNGRRLPVLTLEQNTTYHLRCVNAQVRDLLMLAFVPAPGRVLPEDVDPESFLPLTLLSRDGLTMPRPEPDFLVPMAPGNRTDLLLQVAEPGTYALFEAEFLGATGGDVVGWLEVVASDATPLPAIGEDWGAEGVVEPRLSLDALTADEDDVAKNIVFMVTNYAATEEGVQVCDGDDGPVDQLCGPVVGEGGEASPKPYLFRHFLQYDPAVVPHVQGDPANIRPDDLPRMLFGHQRTDFVTRLDTDEIWLIKNYSATDHPFHVHVNPFFVLEAGWWNDETGAPEGEPLFPRLWWDIFMVYGRAGAFPGYLKIHMRFLNWTGTYPAHCHKLDHEEVGMMQIVRTDPAE